MFNAAVLKQIAALQEQITDMQAQLTSAHQHLWGMRRLCNEVSAANQAVQNLLSFRYKEFVNQKLPLPRPADVQFRCFSQNGEDGILLYIFSLIGTTNQKSVEICAEAGIECNTANLIINHGWHGLLVDGDEELIAQGIEFYSKCQDTFVHPPKLVASWVTVENVNALIEDHGFAGELDLFALDMDGVDYWIWKAIDCIEPRVVVLEFNALWGPEKALTVPYRPDFRRDLNNRYHFFMGASLPAFVKLASEKGLRLVGVERGGFNAFFIRKGLGEDLLPEISPAQAFQELPTLRDWCPEWVETDASGPEQDWVKV